MPLARHVVRRCALSFLEQLEVVGDALHGGSVVVADHRRKLLLVADDHDPARATQSDHSHDEVGLRRLVHNQQVVALGIAVGEALFQRMHRARDERTGCEGIELLVQLPTRNGLAVGKHMLSRLERQMRASQRIDGPFPIAFAAEGDVLAGSLVGKVGFEQLARFGRAFAPVTRERLPHFLLDVSHRRGVRRHDGHPLAARHRHRDDAQDDLSLARARRPFDDGQREMERLVHGDALVAVEGVRALRNKRSTSSLSARVCRESRAGG